MMMEMMTTWTTRASGNQSMAWAMREPHACPVQPQALLLMIKVQN